MYRGGKKFLGGVKKMRDVQKKEKNHKKFWKELKSNKFITWPVTHGSVPCIYPDGAREEFDKNGL